MLRRDPGGVEYLCAARDSGTVGTNDGNLISRIDALGALGRGFGAFAPLAAFAGLREEGPDPGAVDEVAGSAKGESEEQVEEYTVCCVSW